MCETVVVHGPEGGLYESTASITWCKQSAESLVRNTYGAWMERVYRRRNQGDEGWPSVWKTLQFVLADVVCVCKTTPSRKLSFCCVPKSAVMSQVHKRVLVVGGVFKPHSDASGRKHLVYLGTVAKISPAFSRENLVREGEAFLVGGPKAANPYFALNLSSLSSDPADLIAFSPHAYAEPAGSVTIAAMPENPWPPIFRRYCIFNPDESLPETLVERHLYRSVKQRMRFLISVCGGEGRSATLAAADAAFENSECCDADLSAACQFLARCFSVSDEALSWYAGAEAAALSFWIRYAFDLYGTDSTVEFLIKRGLAICREPSPPFDEWVQAVSAECECQITRRVWARAEDYRKHLEAVRSSIPRVLNQLMDFAMEMYKSSPK